MSQQTKSFSLGGGLDLVTPPLDIQHGRIIGGENYEPLATGGYRRVLGYERFDGQPSPTAADYWIAPFDAGSTEIVATDSVTGATSGNAGEVLFVVVESGDWATNDAAGYLVLFNVDGAFIDNELLQVSAVTYATANGVSQALNASTDALHATYLAAAREARREDIGVVPGEGPVRGVWGFSGVKYAFRDNVGQTLCLMYKSSASGWTAVDLGHYIEFTTGTAAFSVGDTVTGGTSGATATVTALIVTSGDWSTNDAAGRLYLSGITGTFQAEAITSAAGAATCGGAQTAVTLQPGGRYEFVTYNFGGASGTQAMYGCDGVNPAFQFDGATFVQILTGMATDTPSHITAYKKHLFLSYASSVQHSSIGDPLAWSVVTGAAEIATGEQVVGFDVQPGDVLAIFNRNATYLLYGTSTADWNLVTHSNETGAIEWSIQHMAESIYMDDRGLSSLSRTQAYGDFQEGTLSYDVELYFRAANWSVLSSVTVREKDQYRLFFQDKSCLLMTKSKRGYMFTFVGFPVTAECCCSIENSNGEEEIYFGSETGYVYQMEKGDSFDGGLITYSLRLPFNNLGRPQHKKRFYKVKLEVDAAEQIPLELYPDFSYGRVDEPIPVVATNDILLVSRGGYWDTNAIWEQFIWDGQAVGSAQAYIDGQGTNVSLLVRGESNYEQPHTIYGVSYNYKLRGLEL